MRPKAEQSGVTIEFNDEGDREGGLWVAADEAQIRQVFLNLALNAIQAMPDGGLLKVDVFSESKSRTHEDVKIRFADTGYGIAGDDLDKVFTPFFTTKGLGLSHGIVQSHGGTLTMHNKEDKEALS